MALPPGANGSAVCLKKLAWRASRVKGGFPICSGVSSLVQPWLSISFTLFLA